MTNREVVLLIKWLPKITRYLPTDAELDALLVKVRAAMVTIIQKRDFELVTKYTLRNQRKPDALKRLHRRQYEVEFISFLNEESAISLTAAEIILARPIVINALMFYSGDFPEV